jgi:putative redox protein
MHVVKTSWLNKMAFNSRIDKHTLRLDSNGILGDDSGPGPKKLLLSALAGCTGMDVVSLLKKMRVSFTGFDILIEADISTQHPRIYTEIRMVYRFFGSNLNTKKIEKAVFLSQDKYCGVSAMLKKNNPIKYSIEYAEDKEAVAA